MQYLEFKANCVVDDSKLFQSSSPKAKQSYKITLYPL